MTLTVVCCRLKQGTEPRGCFKQVVVSTYLCPRPLLLQAAMATSKMAPNREDMTEIQLILSEELYSITQGLTFSVDNWLLGELLSKCNLATHQHVSTCATCDCVCVCVHCCSCFKLAGIMANNWQHWDRKYDTSPFRYMK